MDFSFLYYATGPYVSHKSTFFTCLRTGGLIRHFSFRALLRELPSTTSSKSTAKVNRSQWSLPTTAHPVSTSTRLTLTLICLVGDSAAMVVHGHDTTLPITLQEMLVHCRVVARGAMRPLLVGDLPFGTYEANPIPAVTILKEGAMNAVKLEGGSHSRITSAKTIVEAGIIVMGHVGLTPQAISVLGGFRPQGRNVASTVKVVETTLALQEAGRFSVILECVPAPVAATSTSFLQIPTIGIGAGPFCSGHVLVYHDLLGMLQHPHHAKVTPKFCKQYGHVGVIHKAPIGV